MRREKIVVGLSGGVDSSVAAWLLREQGYEVLGVTMRTWDGKPVEEMTADAAQIAESLGIPHTVVDFRESFRCSVMDYFAEEYLRGRTPNPCVICNRAIKWEALLEAAAGLGADKIATGHYARILRLPNGRLSVQNSVTAAKDQTYALCFLTQEQLAHTLMPVGSYTKEEIRTMAATAGLPAAHKRDSQEICFIPDHDYAAFIGRQAGERTPGPGNFVTADGTVLGRHRGIIHYTIGQRRGLGLPMGRRVVVTQIRPETNEVVIGENEEVFRTELSCTDFRCMSVPALTEETESFGKIRYAHGGEACRLIPQANGRVKAQFVRPVRAVTPGQAAVFYEGDHILGAGIIE